MANNLNQFTLKQLSEMLLGDSNEQLLDDYISKNLIVARNPPVVRLLSQLSDGDIIASLKSDFSGIESRGAHSQTLADDIEAVRNKSIKTI